MPGIMTGHGNVPTQGSHLLKSERYRQKVDNDTIAQFTRKPLLVQRKFVCFTNLAILYSLYYGMPSPCRIGQAAGVRDHFPERVLVSQFVNRRSIHAPR